VVRRSLRALSLAVALAAATLASILAYCAGQSYDVYVAAHRSPLRAARVEGESDAGAFRRSWLKLTAASGREVECGVLAPAASTGRRPAILLLGGRDAGRRSIENARDLPDIVVLSLDYGLDGLNADSVWEALPLVGEARERILRVPVDAMLALDYLRSRPDVDAARISVVGFSFGALFVPCVAAEDRHLATAVMVEGGGDLTRLIQHNLALWTDRPTSAAGGFLGGLLLRPLEPLRFASRVAPTPFLMLNGTADARVPRSCVEALFARAREPRKLIWIEAAHVDPRQPDLIARIVGILDRELRATNAL
jgi:fermentation-respiration switch protein FrsA (DUF1100 family)